MSRTGRLKSEQPLCTELGNERDGGEAQGRIKQLEYRIALTFAEPSKASEQGWVKGTGQEWRRGNAELARDV